MRFLSPEWLDAAAACLAAQESGGAELALTLQQVVRGGPDGDVAYRVRISAGRISLVPGAGEDADLVFSEDWDTAAAIAEGRVSPQAALLDGLIRASGNVALAMRGQEALAALGDALAGVRSSTTYER